MPAQYQHRNPIIDCKEQEDIIIADQLYYLELPSAMVPVQPIEVKVYGIFKCEDCAKRLVESATGKRKSKLKKSAGIWSSHYTTIEINLREKTVTMRGEQKCRRCYNQHLKECSVCRGGARECETSEKMWIEPKFKVKNFTFIIKTIVDRINEFYKEEKDVSKIRTITAKGVVNSQRPPARSHLRHLCRQCKRKRCWR